MYQQVEAFLNSTPIASERKKLRDAERVLKGFNTTLVAIWGGGTVIIYVMGVYSALMLIVLGSNCIRAAATNITIDPMLPLCATFSQSTFWVSNHLPLDTSGIADAEPPSVLLNLPPIVRIPAIEHNAALHSEVISFHDVYPNTTVIEFDMIRLFANIAQERNDFGLKNFTNPCLTVVPGTNDTTVCKKPSDV